MDDEDEEYLYGYVFVVRSDIDRGVILEYFMDVSMAIGRTFEEYQELAETYERMAPGNETSKLMERVSSMLPVLELRARMNSVPVCMVRTQAPLTGDELEKLLQHKQREGQLRPFLDQCKL